MVDLLKHNLRHANSFAGVGMTILGGTILGLEEFGVQQPLYLAIMIGVSALYVGAGLVYFLVWNGQVLEKIAASVERIAAVPSDASFPDDED